MKHAPTSAGGKVELSLYGPKGELRGALLADGTVLRVGPKEAEQVAELLAPGATLAAHGEGVETRHGRAIHVEAIGPDADRLKPIRRPKDKKPKHGHHAHA